MNSSNLLVPTAVNNDQISQYLQEQDFKPHHVKHIMSTLDTKSSFNVTRRELLTRLIKGDASFSGTNLTFANEFNQFIEKLKNRTIPIVWNADSSNNDTQKLFFKSHEDIIGNWLAHSKLLVLRSQTILTCYLNAPFTLLHYLIVISTQGNMKASVNLTRYEAKRRGEDLYQFIINGQGQGGYSRDLLIKMLSSLYPQAHTHQLCQSIILDNEPEVYQKQLETIFEKVNTQPALIASFKLTQNFMNSSEVVYHNEPHPADFRSINKKHSMLLIGARRELANNSNESDRYYFLCQNWTVVKFIVEISDEYMRACGGEIVFVRCEVNRFPNELSDILVESDYLESDIVDTDWDSSLDS